MINMVTVYKAKQGGEKSIIDVIEEATPFGVNKLRQFNLNNTNDYDDNLQEIHMAIINAIKKFNTDKAIALPKLFKRLMMFKNTKMLYIYSEKEINPFLIEKIKNIKDVQICYILHDFCPKKNISTLFIKKNNELYFDKFKCGKYEEINFITFSSIVIQNRLRTLFAERKKHYKFINVDKPISYVKEKDQRHKDIYEKYDIEYIKNKLSAIDYKIFKLYIENYKHKEISIYINKSVNYVKNKIIFIKKVLQTSFKKVFTKE